MLNLINKYSLESMPELEKVINATGNLTTIKQIYTFANMYADAVIDHDRFLGDVDLGRCMALTDVLCDVYDLSLAAVADIRDFAIEHRRKMEDAQIKAGEYYLVNEVTEHLESVRDLKLKSASLYGKSVMEVEE